MNIFFLLLPALIIASALALYRQNGRREILKFDLVQFVYAFVLSPIMFVWMKGALYFLLRQELGLSLSYSELLVIDGVFSTLFLYIYAFTVIHSLTKSFSLKRYDDPMHDIFAHSEFFHQNVSHLVVYVGPMILVVFLALINIMVPFQLVVSRTNWYGILAAGVILGICAHLAVASYQAPSPIFHRFMKLFYAVFFVLLSVCKVLFDVDFSARYLIFWTSFTLFLTLVSITLFIEKTEKEEGLLNRLPFRINPIKFTGYWRYLKNTVHQFYSKKQLEQEKGEPWLN